MLNEFQRQCEARLVALLAKEGAVLVDRAVQGVSESYIVATISGTELHVWIYEDEAEVSGGEIDYRFERQDYDTQEALMKDFLDTVSGVVSCRGVRDC